MTTDSESTKTQSDLAGYVVAGLLAAVLVFLAYSLAAWSGVGHGWLFPRQRAFGEPFTRLSAARGAAMLVPGTCGWKGPVVSREARSIGGIQAIEMEVTDHFSPNVIVVRRNLPLRISINRRTSSACSEKIIFGGLGVTRRLPAGRTSVVTVFPSRPGTYAFTCGFEMMTGRIVVI